MEIDEKFTFAFAAYLLNHAQDLRASQEEAQRRMDICQQCDRFQLLPPPEEGEEEEIRRRFGRTEPFHGCTACGCLLEAKVEGFFEKCPEMKWWPSINFIFDSGMKFDLEDGRKGQQGDIEQWKKYHEDFIRLYQEKEENGGIPENYLAWINAIYRDIIEVKEELPDTDNE